MLKLRPYQQEAVDSLFAYFYEKRGNPILALPTGTGKSVVIADFIRKIFTQWPGQRVLKLTHVKEILTQNTNKLLEHWPTAPVGIYSAGLGRRDIAPITYAGIGSVFKLAGQFGHTDLVIIDEAHLVNSKVGTMYAKLIADLLKINPRLKVIGLSATPWRLGLGLLTEGGIFTDICFDNTSREAFNMLIAEGYLSSPVPKRTSHELDVSGVHIVGGEFVASELQKAVDKSTITYYALKELVQQGSQRRSWLVFTTGVEHTEHVAEMLVKEFGINALPVHSKISSAQRDHATRCFKAGQVQCLVNNNVLTTGFDHPEIDLIGVLRPTASPVLWVQMLGRGTRPVYAPGVYDLDTAAGRLAAIAAGPKQNCLVLDFAANTRRLGPINDPVLPRKKGKRPGHAPVRICEKCNTYNHASALVCSHCGAEFERMVKFGVEASVRPLVAGEMPEIVTFKVDYVTYALHKKQERPDSIKVSYFCGLRMFQEYICFEHTGFTKHKAHEWWRTRFPYNRYPPQPLANGKLWVPDTSEVALRTASQLQVPSHIRIWLNKKYPEVMAYDLSSTGFTGSTSPERLSHAITGKPITEAAV